MARYRPPRPESSKYITPEGAATLAPRARRAVAREATRRHASGVRSGRARRPLGERGIHLRQEAARRDRSASPLPAQAALRASRSSTSSRATRARSYFGAWFELRASTAAAANIGSSARTSRPTPWNTSASIHRSVARCSASALRIPSSCARPTASSATSSCGCATLERERAPKKSPARGRASHRGNRNGLAYCRRAQLINRTSLERKSKFRASNASMSFVS